MCGLLVMGRGRDLTVAERAFVLNKIMQNWDSEKRQIKSGRRKIVLAACKKAGIQICEWTMSNIQIEAKMPWLVGLPYFIQQDGARPHTANGTIEDLVAGGTGDGFVPIIVTQPPNSPDLNIHDLGFFASLKVDVKRICTHCTSREEMMVNVMKAFEEYPREKIDGIWACWYNNLRSVMACDGGNDYKQAHNGGKRRQRETGSACDYTVNLDDYDRCECLCR